jgi:hypothetical protein
MVLMQSRIQEVPPPGQVGSTLITVRHRPPCSALSHVVRRPNANICAFLIRFIVDETLLPFRLVGAVDQSCVLRLLEMGSRVPLSC